MSFEEAFEGLVDAGLALERSTIGDVWTLDTRQLRSSGEVERRSAFIVSVAIMRDCWELNTMTN